MPFACSNFSAEYSVSFSRNGLSRSCKQTRGATIGFQIYNLSVTGSAPLGRIRRTHELSVRRGCTKQQVQHLK